MLPLISSILLVSIGGGEGKETPAPRFCIGDCRLERGARLAEPDESHITAPQGPKHIQGRPQGVSGGVSELHR